MKVFLLLILVGVTSVSGSFHGIYGKNPDPRCKRVGQYLKDGYEKCSYLVCTYGEEPWYDAYGKIRLFTTKQYCAGGTEVADYFNAYETPCSKISYECHPRVSYGNKKSYEFQTNSYQENNKGYGSTEIKGYQSYGRQDNTRGYGDQSNKGFPSQGYSYQENKGYEQSQGYDYQDNTKAYKQQGYDSKPTKGYKPQSYDYQNSNRGYASQNKKGYQPVISGYQENTKIQSYQDNRRGYDGINKGFQSRGYDYQDNRKGYDNQSNKGYHSQGYGGQDDNNVYDKTGYRQRNGH